MNKLKTLSILLAGAAVTGCGADKKSDIEIAMDAYAKPSNQIFTEYAQENIEDVKELQGIENAQCTQVDESEYKSDEYYDAYACSYTLNFLHPDGTEMEINLASYVYYNADEKELNEIYRLVLSKDELKMKFMSEDDVHG
ncbi:conserved hypothetical protein [Vibrio chagasii]|nr:conserved hypothetical protein [Vibrio chagasii]CAH7363507.1 conserved hypothetical protein [Vibrio chagasii]